jgi:DNA-directed RNA polymerase III subunit RPC6
MVYGAIENAGAAGIWTKTLKARIGNHQNVLERSCKSLQARGLIQPMKSVKFPGRKMFILAGVQPNEEATGGAWFADGTLDVGLLDVISQVVEVFVAKESWEEIDTSTYLDEPLSPPTKRKAPVDGFDDGGEPRSKATRTDDGQQKSKPPKKKYQPYPAGYMDYPTVTQISTHVLDKKVTGTTLPQTAIAQLLDVMVYDDKLLKVYRRPRDNEEADHGEDVTMYRCLRTPNALIERHQFAKRKNSHNPHDRKAAARQQELEEIGRGGSSEVPCMRCPVFDICRDGGPVNALTCKYFDEWFLQVEQADKEAGVGQHASDIKPKSTSNRNRDKERAAVTNGEAKLKVQLENLEPS